MTVMGMETHPPRNLAETAASVPAGDEAAFGRFLRQARERRGLSLLQVSRETKIPERHLASLERGNLAAVPRGLYQRGAIRAFAGSVGLDRELAIAQLARVIDTAPPQEAPSARPAHRRRRTPLLAALGIALGLTAAASALALWPRGRPPVREGPGAHEMAPAAPRMARPSPVPAAARVPAAPPGASAGLAAAAEPPATAPPAVDGALTITSEPPGARVTVNGVGWGVTPTVIPHLALGGQRIRVTMDRYRAAERVVTLDQDRPSRTLHLVLDARP